MRCPNCNSDHVQFATKTSGSSFGSGEACCGFLLMGPLGLLCGFCGSDVSTDEFWICQECGHKFSNSEGKSMQNKHDKYLNQKEIRRKAFEEYGDKETIRNKFFDGKARLEEGIIDFNFKVQDYIERERKVDETLDLLCKKMEKGVPDVFTILAVIAFILGLGSIFLFGTIVEGALIAILAAIAVVLLCVIDMRLENAVAKYVLNRSPELKEYTCELANLDGEIKYLDKLLDDINSCENYESGMKHG